MRRFPGWLAAITFAAVLGAILGLAGAWLVANAAALVRERSAIIGNAELAYGRAGRHHQTELLQLLRNATDDGLDPGEYQLAQIERELSKPGDGDARTRANRLIVAALSAYVQRLRIPHHDMGTIYVDGELAPTAPDLPKILLSPDPAKELRQVQDRNPLYRDLRAGLKWYRKRWSNLPQISISPGTPITIGSAGQRVVQLRRRLGLASAGASPQFYDEELGKAVSEFRRVHGLSPSPVADDAVVNALNLGSSHYESLIALNLDRVRGLPLNEARYIFVDVAGARLQMIEDGRVRDAMRVIVGKPGMETPRLAARIRFAIFQPYWNVPPDLVRHSIAPAVLRDGNAYIERRRLAAFTDWQPSAPELDPRQVDWQAVADGTQNVWIRQKPGGDNMMGAVKFMLPNRLGIYLHDTPHKGDFARSDRRLSSGCVRVEDARRLAHWLLHFDPMAGVSGEPDKRIDLPAPVPVYISYLTAVPEAGKVRFQQDVYRRDQPQLEVNARNR